MRRFALILLSSGFAFSAVAQQTISPNNVPVTSVVNAQPVNPAAPTNAIVKTKPVEPVLEDIGFDPKVKRDPQGRIIGDAKPKNDVAVSESKVLRKDSGSTLRSDVRKPVANAPAPVTTTPGMTNTTTTETVTRQVAPTLPQSRR